MFDHKHKDMSIQMDEPKELCDISVEAMGKSMRDASVDQTPQLQNEISVQYSREGREISVQMDRPGQEEVSIQMDRPVNHEISVQLSQP
jgi:hypothetical protein